MVSATTVFPASGESDCVWRCRQNPSYTTHVSRNATSGPVLVDETRRRVRTTRLLRSYENWYDGTSMSVVSVGNQTMATRPNSSCQVSVRFPFGSVTRNGAPNSGCQTVTVWCPSALVTVLPVGTSVAGAPAATSYVVVVTPPFGSVTLNGRP